MSNDDQDINELQDLKSIWEDDMVEKFIDKNSNKSLWRCKWCNKEFSGWNATKAMQHVNRISKVDIKPCTASISEDHKKRYSDLYNKTLKKRKKNEASRTSMDNMINNHNNITAKVLDNKKNAFSVSSDSKRQRQDSLSTVSRLQTLSQDSSSIVSGVDQDGDGYIQRRLYDGPNPSGDCKLTMAVADLIHSCGLPFSLSSHPKFKKVLQLAKCVGTDYKPPSRIAVAGSLLDVNYDAYIKKNNEEVMKEANVYGLSFYGDGATVKKMPLINILVAGAHMTTHVLDIVDCTSHLEGGGKKDARYIASLFRQHIDSFKSETSNICDVIFFDGASNVQKGGQVIQATYPRIEVLHGAEHVISLFFRDVFLIPEFKVFDLVCKKIYSVFGNGSMHLPYALFQKHSRQHNSGKNIGLMRAAETRMAGCALCLIRLLRLRTPLVTTVNSAEFISAKVKVRY